MYRLMTCLCFLMIHTQDHQFQSFGADPLQNRLIQEQQLNMERSFVQQQERQLYPWISEQIQAYEEEQILTKEQFSFQVDRQVQFRWKPSAQGFFKLSVEIFLQEDGDIYMPQNPNQNQCVSIFVKPSTENHFKQVGKVYIEKVLNLSFFTPSQMLKIVNNYNRKILVQIGVEDSGFVPGQGIQDDNLKLSTQKMQAIMSEVKQTELKRQTMYKSEWGFKDREQRHQSEMLVLTGVELLVILSTAMIQMFCIRSLIENRPIV